MTTTDDRPDLHALRHHGDLDVAPGLIDLAVNVRADAPPPWLRQRVLAADLSSYPDQREAVAAVAARHHRDPLEVLLTAGAAEAFVLIARAFSPRHAVVVHPQFTEPELALRNAGHEVERVILPYPYEFDPALVPDDADLVIIGNPTNPTSVLHSATALASLARPGRILVVDEAFADCIPDEPQSLAQPANLAGLIVVRSLTKTWGLAGLRAGYLLAEPAHVELLRAVQPHWAVSSPALAACVACSEPAAVEQARLWACELAEHRVTFCDLLAGLPGVEVVPNPQASFVLLRTGHPDLRRALHGRGFAVRRGETFPGLDDSWIRVAVRDPSISRDFVAALGQVLSGE